MTFDAGKIQATADLDKRPFIVGLAQLRAEGRKFASERYSAKVDADTARGNAKVIDFQERLKRTGRGTTTATVDANTTKALLKLQPVVDRLLELRTQVATARVDANTDDARRKLDAIDLSLRRVGAITAKPRVSLEGVERAEIQLDALAARIRAVGAMDARVGASGGGGRGGVLGALGALGGHAPRGLTLAIGAGLPLIPPLASLAAGGAASFLTPALAGGIGGGLFAKAAASSYEQLDKDLKTLTADQQRYNTATTSKARAAALATEKSDWAALGKSQQRAVTTVQRLKTQWADFQKRLRPQTFGLLATGADIASKGLKLLLPATRAAGQEINSLATSADHALSQPFWQNFFGRFLPGQASQALHALGTGLGAAGTGIAHLMEQFAPLGDRLDRDIVKWGRDFEQWTEGRGPAKFVSFVEKEGPVAARGLEALAHGLEGLGKGLMPLGQVELRALTPILNFVGDLGDEHPAVITALGGALLGIAGGLKAIALVKGVGATAGAVATLVGAIRSGRGMKGALGDILSGGAGGKGLGCCCGGPGTPVSPAPAAEAAETGGTLGFLKTLGDKLGLSKIGRAAADLPGVAEAAAGLAGKISFGRLLGAVGFGGSPDVRNPGMTNYFGGSANGGISVPTNMTKTLKDQISLLKQARDAGPAAASGYQMLIEAFPKAARAIGAVNDNQRALNRLLVDSQTATGGVKAKVDAYRQSLVAQGVPMDAVIAKTAAYAAKLRAVPPHVNTSVNIGGDANRMLDVIRQKIVNLPDHTVRITTTTRGGSTSTHGLSLNAAGGYITGPGTATSDSIPAWLSNGEYVLRASAVRHIGLDTLNAMNRYAGGGKVQLPRWLTSQGSPVPVTGGGGSSGHGGSPRGGSGSSGPSQQTIANALAAIANYAGATFVNDLRGTTKQVRAGIKQMIDRLNAAVRNDYLDNDKTLVRVLRRSRGTLVALAQQELLVSDALTASQRRLSNLRSDAASIRSGAVSSFLGLGDLTQASNTTTVAGLLDVQGQQVRLAKAFHRNLATLRKRGLSRDEYRTLAADGPAAAGGIVGLLTTASRGQLRTLNSGEALLRRLGVATGQASAQYLDGRQITAARRDVEEQRADRRRIARDQKRTADAVESLVKAGLHDKGTHAALATLHSDLADVKQLLRQLANVPGHARTNQRSHVAGVNR